MALCAGLLCVAGCAGGPHASDGPDRIFFVPGVAGDGPWYDGLRRGLTEGGIAEGMKTVSWGAPPPLTMLNFQTQSIHNSAEVKLAEKIARWHADHPDGRIRLIGHSAGGGVVLGGLARLRPGIQVDDVILLNPSVSPQYDLAVALARVGGRLHLFCSDRDKLFLGWRTSTFGSYDNVKTEAAGKVGFRPATTLPAELTDKLVQHRYEKQWQAMGNQGDHFGATGEAFVKGVIAPLMESPLASD